MSKIDLTMPTRQSVKGLVLIFIFSVRQLIRMFWPIILMVVIQKNFFEGKMVLLVILVIVVLALLIIHTILYYLNFIFYTFPNNQESWI